MNPQQMSNYPPRQLLEHAGALIDDSPGVLPDTLPDCALPGPLPGALPDMYTQHPAPMLHSSSHTRTMGYPPPQLDIHTVQPPSPGRGELRGEEINNMQQRIARLEVENKKMGDEMRKMREVSRQMQEDSMKIKRELTLDRRVIITFRLILENFDKRIEELQAMISQYS